ncbi:uncharacterized protein LOC135341749 [Halichondria panicea]|uniref:uncharacterized protein LOC135341749 n=1 Tax=Halichondria panicea TaxID=6063 RepID=UPI00312BB0D9
MCYTQHYSTVSTPAGWMKVALKQTNLSLRSLRFQTGHVFPIQGHSPLEKEVLYFNILLSESEKPQQSLSHPFDVTFYTLVPEDMQPTVTLCIDACPNKITSNYKYGDPPNMRHPGASTLENSALNLVNVILLKIIMRHRK